MTIPTWIEVGGTRCTFEILADYSLTKIEENGERTYGVRPKSVQNIRIPKGLYITSGSFQEYLTIFWKEYQEVIERKAPDLIRDEVDDNPKHYDIPSEADSDG